MLLLLSTALAAAPGDLPPLRDGDLVFQASRSDQAQWIRLATNSPLTHVGLVDVEGGTVFVIEAVQPVRVTPLADFRARYGDPRVAVKRAPGRSDAERSSVVTLARSWVGLAYDARFEWSDTKLYCSELVWKAWDRVAGVRLSPLGTFADVALLDAPEAAELVRARWGAGGPDRTMPVVSPADLWRSAATEVVVDQVGVPGE